MQMKSAVDVADTQVQKMVEESVEFAFDDMDVRRWVESSMKAEEAIKAARAGMEEFADELDNAEEIAAAITAIEMVVEAGNSETGNLHQLKEAVAELDAASLPLADLIMNRAMEAMLRKRGTIN